MCKQAYQLAGETSAGIFLQHKGSILTLGQFGRAQGSLAPKLGGSPEASAGQPHAHLGLHLGRPPIPATARHMTQTSDILRLGF